MNEQSMEEQLCAFVKAHGRIEVVVKPNTVNPTINPFNGRAEPFVLICKVDENQSIICTNEKAMRRDLKDLLQHASRELVKS